MLDIGCDTGRMARHLTDHPYVGFDLSKAAIGMCKRRHPQLTFIHLDVWNGDYNRGGAIAEDKVVFPASTASVDVAFAMSVFTHMRFAAMSHYLKEAARTLKPGGRFAFTAFSPRMAENRLFDFQDYDATSSVVDPRSPERAIAHALHALNHAIKDAGLTVLSVHKGNWAPPADYDGGQDLWGGHQGLTPGAGSPIPSPAWPSIPTSPMRSSHSCSPTSTSVRPWRSRAWPRGWRTPTSCWRPRSGAIS